MKITTALLAVGLLWQAGKREEAERSARRARRQRDDLASDLAEEVDLRRHWERMRPTADTSLRGAVEDEFYGAEDDPC